MITFQTALQDLRGLCADCQEYGLGYDCSSCLTNVAITAVEYVLTDKEDRFIEISDGVFVDKRRAKLIQEYLDGVRRSQEC